MPLSPFQRHRARVLAEQAAQASPFGEETQGSEYQLYMAKLAADKRTLKQIESILLKRRTKARLLLEYLPWIDGVLTKGQGAQDIVLTTVMVWAIDAGAYSIALDIGAYVLKHGLALPDHYNRTPATVLIDEFSDAYLRNQWTPLKRGSNAAGEPEMVADDIEPVHYLIGAGALTEASDAPDQARAKLRKATAYALLGKVQTAESPDLEKLPAEVLQMALSMLHAALSIDPESGVKKDIERIERKLAAASAGKVTLPDVNASPAVAAAPVADTAAAAAEPTPKTDVVNNKTAAKKLSLIHI